MASPNWITRTIFRRDNLEVSPGLDSEAVDPMHPIHSPSVAALIVVILIAATAFPASRNVTDAKSLRCTFPWSVSAEWQGTADPKIDIPDENQPFVFHIDSIDRKKNTARIIGNVGTADAVVISTQSDLHILEITPTGGLNTLSVDNKPTSPGVFRAVYSRHSWLNMKIVSQFYGTCEEW